MVSAYCYACIREDQGVGMISIFRNTFRECSGLKNNSHSSENAGKVASILGVSPHIHPPSPGISEYRVLHITNEDGGLDWEAG